MVAAGFPQVRDVIGYGSLIGQNLCLPGVFDLNIIEFFNFRERIISHPQFIALIYEGRSLQC